MEWADDHELWAGNMCPQWFQQLMKQFKWTETWHIYTFPWCYDKEDVNWNFFFFSKWNWFNLIPRKRWVTVAAERIQWISKLWICQHLQWILHDTFHHFSISANICQENEQSCRNQQFLMHKPVAFTICAVQCCGRCCAHWPHLCVKGCGWTDRRERLDMAKKRGPFPEASRRKVRLLGGRSMDMVRNETWIWVELDFSCHNGNVRDTHPNFTQSSDPLLIGAARKWPWPSSTISSCCSWTSSTINKRRAQPGNVGMCKKQRECPTSAVGP